MIVKLRPFLGRNRNINNPIIKIAIILICSLTILKIIPLLLEKIIETENNSVNQLFTVFAKCILIVLIIVLIKKARFINRAFLLRNNLLSTAIIAVFLFLSFKDTYNSASELGFQISNYDHTMYFIKNMATGFFEELLFRVLIFAYVCAIFKNVKKNSPIREVVLTSLIFAFIHFTNFFNPNYEKLGVITQMFFAFSMGLILQSIFYRFNNIILIGFLHGLVNYNGMKKTLLFHIEKTKQISMSDVTNSLLTISLFTLFIVIPIMFICLRKRENYLINQSST